jgi:hypothetical protein
MMSAIRTETNAASPFPATRHITAQPVHPEVLDRAPRLRITRRGRAVLAAVIALPLAFGAAAAVLNGGGAVATNTPSAVEFTFVEVEDGQSLWSLAETIAPHADPRDVISGIVELNALPSADVQPGERLAIPFEYLP